MKTKTIKAVLRNKFDSFTASIKDEVVRKLVEQNTIITGGAIASMLLREQVNDFDLYFRNLSTTEAVANYYVAQFVAAGHALKVDVDKVTGRVRIVVPKGYRGATAGNPEEIDDPGQVEDKYEEAEKQALGQEDEKDKPQFRPVFMSTNAITLSQKVQLVLRFYGEPDVIHESYDFVHCTNYWTSWDNNLVLRPDALEVLLTKELRYIGSKYPVCSIIRLRKFIARQWTINAGQILKILMQINDLELTDPKVLEDQLTGVDCAFFSEILQKLQEKDPEKINAAYLVEIIDRIF